MSTYAVFGMTRTAAIGLAKKIADREVGNVDESKWHKIVAAEADKIMKSGKCVMLSDKFDAPSFAQEFRSLAAKVESRDLQIKAYCKSNSTNPKTGKTKMHWVAA